MRQAFQLFDVIRIDHFRGFEDYWSVPAGEKTAINGKWIKAPGIPLFEAIAAARRAFDTTEWPRTPIGAP